MLSLLREYPRKTFGFLYANEGETSVADYYIFHDDDRSKEEVARSFESIGEYYRHNSNAGFLATATEVVAENEHRKAMRYRRVAAFHTHLRHPAYFAEVDQQLHPLPSLWHFLVSLRNPAHPELAAFMIKGGQAFQIPIINQSSPSPTITPTLQQPRLLDSVEFLDVGGGLQVSKTMITVEQYYKVFSYDTPEFTDAHYLNQPMVNVSWNDATTFCTITGTRLLTPAEWDRLCDDQVATQRQGMRAPELLQYAVFSESPNNRLQRVATKKPNKFGLYDMLGNAWEWCDSANPIQAPSKGGSYFSFAETCRSTISVDLPKTYRARDLGFRVCYRSNS